ncbi:MAG: TonB-dependent receptor [Hydrocarboniphaga sp.]|uniref:TonB-dependent receptor n=1 Tax=Hydrocarboniphaga sp. TaxID=2033016 RepID=UPI0026095619|nr:TonB-dependent receptor [Hydrocarboniphaga sp.]MDB5972417.1 TonB-dependent receptor [Hydrocarboniphaga sp.]
MNPRIRKPSSHVAVALLLACAPSLAARAGDAPPAAVETAAAGDAIQLETIIVNGQTVPSPELRTPAAVVTVDADTLSRSTNLINTEDALKYLPSLLVRKRYIGDTNAPVATRTTGINASARSLIYVDGLLLSTLVNNNNGNGSPQWFLVQPGEIDHIDVMYGPYAAAYPGNSYGAVTEITTRAPSRFESDLKLGKTFQPYQQYGTDEQFNAYELSAGIGDRIGALSWRLGLNHLDSYSQPVTYLTIAKSTALAGEGDPTISGAFADRSRTGSAIQVLGAGNLTHTQQDSISAKFAYDFSPALTLGYTGALWQNTATTRPDTYLKTDNGVDYIGNSAGDSGKVNIDGFSYSAGAIAPLYANGSTDQQHLAHSLSLKNLGEKLDWQILFSDFSYLRDQSRSSMPSFTGSYQNASGRITDAGDTGWRTADAKLDWKPQGAASANIVSAGVHADQYRLGSPIYDTADWFSGGKGALFSDSRGKTRTLALWLQDRWRFAPRWTAIVGGRYESWKGFDGFNSNRTGSAGAYKYYEVDQPEADKKGLSPKASLAWQATNALQLKASVGRALRFPTVGELYQNIATGTTFTQADPNLKPEDVVSGELSASYISGDTDLRLTLFQETVKDLLISQNAYLDKEQTITASFVQNLDKTRQRGVELAATRKNLLTRGLEFSGSLTYVDAEILQNDSYVAPISTPDATSVGKRTPYVAKWRATVLATYRPDEQWAFTLAGRYATRLYATVDGSDTNTHTYQGFDGYTVFDTRASYQINTHWSAALGIDNLNNEKYFLFHPFPQRTAFAELGYRF